jgi:4'-phosphopantetheinyl transferase
LAWPDAWWQSIAKWDQVDRFFQLWTAKEAYLKARGLGVSGPLAEVQILFGGDGTPTLALGVALRDTAGRWQLEISRPTNEHVCAVCIERHEGEGRIVINRRWETQASDEAFLARDG